MFVQITPKVREFYNYECKVALVIICSDYAALREVMKSNAELRIKKLQAKIEKAENQLSQDELNMSYKHRQAKNEINTLTKEYMKEKEGGYCDLDAADDDFLVVKKGL